MGGEALAAIDGPIALGHEGNRGGLAAGGAHRLIGFAGRVGTAGLPGGAAILAAGGLILEALLRVELLLTGGEHELSAAIAAYKRFVLVHHGDPPIPFKLMHPADLVFDPTLAVWEVAQRIMRPHALLSESLARSGRTYL